MPEQPKPFKMSAQENAVQKTLRLIKSRNMQQEEPMQISEMEPPTRK